jgi:endonuclease III
MNKQQRLEIFKRFSEQNPHPETELKYNTVFELMIAVMLSAQSTDKKVNEVTHVLFSLAKTPEAILVLGEERLKTILKSINYYLTKTKHLLETCRMLIALHHSAVPDNRTALEALPGIGRKTANVILNIAFHQPTIAVDTHIFRVANRTGLSSGKTPFEVEQELLRTIDPQYLSHAHHWLVLHGRYVCTARKPHCSTCLIRDLCEYEFKTSIPQ